MAPVRRLPVKNVCLPPVAMPSGAKPFGSWITSGLFPWPWPLSPSAIGAATATQTATSSEIRTRCMYPSRESDIRTTGKDGVMPGLPDLHDEIRTHHGCGFEICEAATHLVPGEGAVDADVVLVGEAPGRQEDEQGRPFCGRAGQLL